MSASRRASFIDGVYRNRSGVGLTELDAAPVGDRVHQPPDVLVGGLGAGAQGAAVVLHPLLDPAEAVGVEQVLQHVVPVLGRGVQEPLELALREHRHLLELGGAHADELGDHQSHLGGA